MNTQNITELFKTAIADPEMRTRFVADPVATCAKFGIKAGLKVGNDIASKTPVVDSSILQGRFRP